jgi:hypothetical protein
MDDDINDLPGDSDHWEEMQPVVGCTLRADRVQLYRHYFGPDDNDICALIGLDPVKGIAGFGASVHEALRNVADNLVEKRDLGRGQRMISKAAARPR